MGPSPRSAPCRTAAAVRDYMPQTEKSKPPFDPRIFLAKVGAGRKILDYRNGQVVFSQGDHADAVFYLQKGKPELVIPKISQQMLAEIIGTTRARVNFFMNRFRKLGFVDYNGGLHVHSSLLNVVPHD